MTNLLKAVLGLMLVGLGIGIGEYAHPQNMDSVYVLSIIVSGFGGLLIGNSAANLLWEG